MHSEVSKARATLASLHRCVKNGERQPEVLLVAKERLEEAKLSAKIDELVAAAPVLSDEQRTRLAELLKPVRVSATDRKSVVAERIAELDGGAADA